MVGPIFVCDAQGTPLMPTAPAYARRLLHQGKAVWQPHHAFPVIRLTRLVEQPSLRPIVVVIDIQLDSARLLLVADSNSAPITLLSITIDLRTDLVWRIRRRAEHRRRRRSHNRYRAAKRQGIPYKRRKPSMLRSSWRHQHPRRTHHSISARTASPIMTWRAQAILRTINALQQLLPISDVVITNQDGRIRYSTHDTNLRQRLIEAYGTLVNGERQPICAYCGTTKGSFVVDHVVPQSRGGTDAWSNVVLACARCNARKADRTPEEAGMVIRHQHQVFRSNRVGIYRSATRAALEYGLSQKQLRVHAETIDPNIAALITDVQNMFATPSPHSPPIIAKVIARGAKQRYTARNYPKTTTLKPGWEWRGTAVKRRTRVNSAMLIYRSTQKTIVKVVPEGKVQAVDPGGIEVHTGMLCEGKRANQLVTGIVAAIESSGRLRLLVPKSIEAGRVRWQRIVISPRQHLRVLANEPVVFLRSATS